MTCVHLSERPPGGVETTQPCEAGFTTATVSRRPGPWHGGTPSDGPFVSLEMSGFRSSCFDGCERKGAGSAYGFSSARDSDFPLDVYGSVSFSLSNAFLEKVDHSEQS